MSNNICRRQKAFASHIRIKTNTPLATKMFTIFIAPSISSHLNANVCTDSQYSQLIDKLMKILPSFVLTQRVLTHLKSSMMTTLSQEAHPIE